MARVFIVGAHIARGGAYMAYHVGRIVGQRLAAETVAVQVGGESPARSTFTYPDHVSSVPIDHLLDVATSDDVLVCNPVYSPHQFGLRFPGRTVMYVQGVNTYAVIDGFFDHYVACSTFVRDHLALLYGWDVPVIVPFVHTERIGATVPFGDRPPGSVAVVTKTLGDELFGLLEARLAAVHPEAHVSFTPLRGLPHDEVLRVMQQHRYLLTLTVFEGHPLMPIEAMLSGCCVVGFHGGGGLEYMRPGINADVVGYPRIDAVTDRLAALVADPVRSAAMAAVGRSDVGRQTYDEFRDRWTAYVDAHLSPT